MEELAPESALTPPGSLDSNVPTNLGSDVKYRCSSCSFILQEPVQSHCCGIRLCKSCVENCEGSTIKCPQCGEEISKNTVYRDNHDQPDTNISFLRNINAELQLHEPNNVLTGATEALNAGLQRLHAESLHRESSTETSIQKPLLSLIQEHNALSGKIQTNREILQQDIASLTQKFHELQHVSYDGTLIWKITNFQEKMADAQSERQTSIYSPPFYSSPTGYKMCARLHLYGDGDARRTHMSLFFVLMRGPNDAILKFPFNYQVTFCLYDQTSPQRHIVDSFRPDIRSNSFQRPRSEMNIASGIPKFIPLAAFPQENNPYIRDDTIFIKIMVDFSNLPRPLLPDVLKINPGLPPPVQHEIVREMVTEYWQQQ